MSATSSAIKRDFPIPASPTMVTSSHRDSSSTRCHARRKSSTSSERPTNGVACARSGASCTASNRWAWTGSLLPFSASGSTGPVVTAPRTSPSVSSPIRISPGWAACSSRAATLTASPVTSRSSVPVTTSPVLIPIRPATPSSGRASRISSAALQARRASSSCIWGTPKTAMTASPMNFSTVPSWDSTIPFMHSK